MLEQGQMRYPSTLLIQRKHSVTSLLCLPSAAWKFGMRKTPHHTSGVKIPIASNTILVSGRVTTLAAEVELEDESSGGGSLLLSRTGSVFGAVVEGPKLLEPELTVENMPPEPLEELLEPHGAEFDSVKACGGGDPRTMAWDRTGSWGCPQHRNIVFYKVFKGVLVTVFGC